MNKIQQPNPKDLVIKPIEIDESKFKKVDFEPFTFPSLLIGLGKVASGKTTFMSNLIRILEPVFNGNVILFSPTLANDPMLDKLIEDDDILEYFDNYTNDNLRRVYETISETEEINEDQKYLIIFDDILGSLPRVGSKEAVWFDKMISTFRHGCGQCAEGSISLMFFVQYFNSLTPVLRTNASYYALLGQQGDKQLKTLAEELHPACGDCDEDFMEVYNKAKQVPYDFLLLDFRKMRAFRNLTELLYDKYGETNSNKEKEKDKDANEKDKDANEKDEKK